MVKFMKVNLVSFTSTIGSFNSSVNLQFCVKIAMFHHGKSTTRDGSEERRTITKFRLRRRLTNVNFPFLLISKRILLKGTKQFINTYTLLPEAVINPLTSTDKIICHDNQRSFQKSWCITRLCACKTFDIVYAFG